MEPHLNELIQYAFYAVISFLAVRVVKSIDELNIKIAIIIEKTDRHEKVLEKHDNRIVKLEEH